jgi:hypothetical protein
MHEGNVGWGETKQLWLVFLAEINWMALRAPGFSIIETFGEFL